MIYNPSESAESIIGVEEIEPPISWDTLIIGAGVVALIGTVIYAFQ